MKEEKDKRGSSRGKGDCPLFTPGDGNIEYKIEGEGRREAGRGPGLLEIQSSRHSEAGIHSTEKSDWS